MVMAKALIRSGGEWSHFLVRFEHLSWGWREKRKQALARLALVLGLAETLEEKMITNFFLILSNSCLS